MVPNIDNVNQCLKPMVKNKLEKQTENLALGNTYKFKSFFTKYPCHIRENTNMITTVQFNSQPVQIGLDHTLLIANQPYVQFVKQLKETHLN